MVSDLISDQSQTKTETWESWMVGRGEETEAGGRRRGRVNGRNVEGDRERH